jgi:hypothetical protein
VRPTQGFETVAAQDRFVRLEKGVHVLDVADAAREAALAFVSMSGGGWGRRELASWLVESYEPATVVPRAGAKRSAVNASGDGIDLREDEIVRVVARARRHALDLVATASTSWRGEGFAREMVDAGLVVGVSDELGALGYAPVRRPGMRLADRVVSLFLADFLSRPADYDAMRICRSCSMASFDDCDVHEEGCEDRGPVSAIIVKRHRFTRLGLGTR